MLVPFDCEGDHVDRQPACRRLLSAECASVVEARVWSVPRRLSGGVRAGVVAPRVHPSRIRVLRCRALPQGPVCNAIYALCGVRMPRWCMMHEVEA